MIDISALSYSDAMKYREDYLSSNPIYNITDEEFHLITANYGFETGFGAFCKRFFIWYFYLW